MSLSKITTCLWFETQAEEAANHYVSVFPNSKITHIQRYTAAGQGIHQKEPGSVMMVAFDLNGHQFTALNGCGPGFKHSEAVSFQISCEDQAEVDHYWEKLGEGGAEEKQMCGWLADKWSISWQVIPKQFFEFMKDKDVEKVKRVTTAMMGMKKLDIEGLTKAYEGEA